MRESQIEQYLVKRVKEAGGIAYKFTSPQRRSVPDRIVLLSGGLVYEDEHGSQLPAPYDAEPVTVFVELKAPGKKPTPAQQREHERIRAVGHRVEIIDSKEGVDAFIRRFTG